MLNQKNCLKWNSSICVFISTSQCDFSDWIYFECLDAFVLITAVVSTETFLLFRNVSRVLMLIECQTFQGKISNSIDLSETNQILLSKTGVSHVFLDSCFIVYYNEPVVILERKIRFCFFFITQFTAMWKRTTWVVNAEIFCSLGSLFSELQWGPIFAFLRPFGLFKHMFESFWAYVQWNWKYRTFSAKKSTEFEELNFFCIQNLKWEKNCLNTIERRIKMTSYLCYKISAINEKRLRKPPIMAKLSFQRICGEFLKTSIDSLR